MNIDWANPSPKQTPKEGYGVFKEVDKNSIYTLLGAGDANLPILLFVENPDKKYEADNLNIKDVVLRDERVMIGTKFFRRYKTAWSAVDEKLAKVLGDDRNPSFFVFNTDGKLEGKVNEHFSPGKVADLMASNIKHEFKSNLFDVIRRVQFFLSQIDKLSDRMKTAENATKKPAMTESQAEQAKARVDQLKAEGADLSKSVREIYANSMKREEKKPSKASPANK
ncbi:MAG: hypothetical protein HY286_14215 [Planctomycetes bacterium]|nr:hypothetical protein [Planctomycetota bacterium]